MESNQTDWYPQSLSCTENGNHSKKILIVGHDQSMRQMLKWVMEDAGYRPLIARDGREALHILQHHIPHLVLSDLVLPFVDGWQLYATMRHHPTYASIPFIAMSGLPPPHQKEHALVPNVIVKKPFDIWALIEIVDHLIQQRD
jgi:CheY-like chemotaxis protein